jgi:hypothetical protein
MKKSYLLVILTASFILSLQLYMIRDNSSASAVDEWIFRVNSGQTVHLDEFKATLIEEGYSFGAPVAVPQANREIPFPRRVLSECPDCVAIVFSRRLEPTLTSLKGEFRRGWVLVRGDQVWQVTTD